LAMERSKVIREERRLGLRKWIGSNSEFALSEWRESWTSKLRMGHILFENISNRVCWHILPNKNCECTHFLWLLQYTLCMNLLSAVDRMLIVHAVTLEISSGRCLELPHVWALAGRYHHSSVRPYLKPSATHWKSHWPRNDPNWSEKNDEWAFENK
jgi:hypothetical protein